MLRTSFLVGVATLFLLSCAAPVSAQQQQRRWTTRFFGSLFLVPNQSEIIPRPEDGSPGSGGAESVTLDMGDGVGLGFGIEYRLTRHLFGIELGAMAAKLDTRVGWTTAVGGTVAEDPFGAMIPLTVAANFHLLRPASAADFYVAALVSWNLFDDAVVRHPAGDKIELENSFGIGFDLGLSYAVAGGPFLISGLVRYLAPQTVARVTFESSGDAVSRNLQFSPLVLNLGVGYRL